MKKYFYTILLLISLSMTLKVFAIDVRDSEKLRNDMIPQWSSDVITSTKTWEWLLDVVLEFVRDSMFRLLLLIAVAMFLYLWAKLLVARWNAEEFKKALMGLIYAWVGLFVVAAAYAMVTFIAWMKIL